MKTWACRWMRCWPGCSPRAEPDRQSGGASGSPTLSVPSKDPVPSKKIEEAAWNPATPARGGWRQSSAIRGRCTAQMEIRRTETTLGMARSSFSTLSSTWLSTRSRDMA